MSVRKSSHGTIFLIVSSGSPRALIASSLRSTSKKPFCPMTRSLHPPMTACGHRVRFAATWREEFFEVPWNQYDFLPTYFDDENNLSLVVFVTCGEHKFIFPGDMERAGWLQLLRNEAFVAE